MANTTFSGPVLAQNGFQLPSFTNSQILSIPNPETGLLVFNSTTTETAFYTGTTWVGAAPPPPPSVTYTAGVDWDSGPAVQGFSGLGLTAVTSPTPDLVAIYDPQSFPGGTVPPYGWPNTSALADILSQPSGTVFTVVFLNDPTVYTITSTAAWAPLTNIPPCISAVQYTGVTPVVGASQFLKIASITFAPAAKVTYSLGVDFTASNLTVASGFSGGVYPDSQTIGSLFAMPAGWINPAAFTALTSLPPGTWYTITGALGVSAFNQLYPWTQTSTPGRLTPPYSSQPNTQLVLTSISYCL